MKGDDNMQVHDYGKLPEGYDYPYGDVDSLSEWDMERLQELGIDEAWYWYATAPYEGSGQILMRKGDKYDVHDMGHCSCYGPMENAHFNGVYSSLDEIQQKCSAEAYKEIAPLVNMARGSVTTDTPP
jgi:hypothetical protein